MLDKKIKVTITALGKPTVEAIGFNGVGCEAATKGIEGALSGEGGATREYKPEWTATDTEEKETVKQSW